jgi:pyruvate kinase
MHRAVTVNGASAPESLVATALWSTMTSTPPPTRANLSRVLTIDTRGR